MIRIALLLFALLGILPASAQDAPPAVEAEVDEVQAAVDRGVAYLLSQQDDNGAISQGDRHRVATTALSAMAMLGVGHQPTDPTPEGRAIRQAIDVLLDPDLQTADGYFGSTDGSNMYGHGIVTLLFGELAGMGVNEETDTRIREALELGIDLILRSQDVEKNETYDGGWRYSPGSADSDLSISVWQVMALRSAQSAEVDVPAKAIDRAIAFLERSFQAEPGSGVGPTPPMGRFGYRPNAGREDFTFSTTSAGLLAMQVCGQYDAPEVIAAAEWLINQPIQPNSRWFYYGLYYYAQGMDQRQGDYAQLAQRRVESALLALQRDDGSWHGANDAADPVYATSMALLSLSVRYHYLPIYQR